MTTLVGLAVRSIEVLRSRERNNEIVFVTYAGSDASVQDGNPVVAISQCVEDVPRRERFEFGGVGLLVVPPMEIRDKLIAWRVEVWEVDSGTRRLGDTLQSVVRSIHMESPVVAALAGMSAGAAITAIGKLAEYASDYLSSNGDDGLLQYSGSLFKEQLEALGGSVIRRDNDDVIVEFVVVVTEGSEPYEDP